MKISNRLKERFCKDCNIPIRLYDEPYFMDRIKLYDKFYDTMKKWKLFVEELQNYKCEQDYFEEYNKIKDSAISCIKETEAYQKFNAEDMNKYMVIHKNLPNSDIYKLSSKGRIFISIDMKKANFSSLQFYDRGMFYNANTWEDFMCRFTFNEHIINSKYIRQVILGNCNPKRHITYEKRIMDQTLSMLEKKFGKDLSEKIVFFSNDEIIYDITDWNRDLAGELSNTFRWYLHEISSVPFSVELFTLHKIDGTDGYYKEIYEYSSGIGFEDKRRYELKGLDSYAIPFVIRKFLNEEATENDKVFLHNGLLSKFIEVPEIEVNLKEVI